MFPGFLDTKMKWLVPFKLKIGLLILSGSIAGSVFATGFFTTGFWQKPPNLAIPVLAFSNLPMDNVKTAALNVSVGGTGVMSYRYKFGPTASTDCTNPTGYSVSPISIGLNITDTVSNITGQVLKLCGIGINGAAVEQAYATATQYTWIHKPAVTAIIIGGPSGTSTTDTPTMSIAGADVILYQFKAGGSASIDCTSATGYSPFFHVGPLTLDLTTLDDGPMKLCVLGKNAGGDIQLLTTPTTLTWTKAAPVRVSFLKGADEVVEGAGAITVGVKLKRRSPIDVHLSLNGVGTAIEGTHYTFGSKSITIPAGSTTGSITVNILSGIPNGEDRALQIYFDEVRSNEAVADESWYTNYLIQDTNVARDLVVDTSLRYDHGCAVKASGKIACWGSNGSGNLGDGTTVSRENAVNISGTTWSKVAAGFRFTCALTTTGTANCWGSNSYGEVGKGAATGSFSTPQAVAGGLTLSQIVTGSSHACGLTTTKKIYCWGANTSGQLGDSSNSSRNSPVAISRNDLDWKFIAAGPAHTCAIEDVNGALWCWGNNDDGQINPSYVGSNIPILVDNTDSYKLVSSGRFSTCAINSTDDLKCFGGNYGGEAGFPRSYSPPTPEQTDIGIKYKSVVVGTESDSYLPRSCGITLANELRCWGTDAGNNGAVGRKVSGSYDYRPSDYTDPGTTYSVIAVSSYAACGVTTAGNLRCFGSTSTNSLLTVRKHIITTPTDVFPLATFKKVFLGQDQGCAIDSTDHLYCYGEDSGSGDKYETKHWIKVKPSSTFKKVAVGPNQKCAIDSSDQLWCWGLIDGTNFDLQPKLVPGISAVDVAAGEYHVCVLDNLGKILCVGNNFSGQLGRGTTGPADYTFTEVSGGITFKKLSAFASETCAIGSNDRVYCWGTGFAGEGSSSITLSTPTLTSDTTTYQSIATTSYSSCGITIAGVVKCWGRGSEGQLGNGGIPLEVLVPSPVTSAETFNRIAVDGFAACAINTSLKLFCWGQNGYYFPPGDNRLGTGSTSLYVTVPTAVDPASDYLEVSVQKGAASDHICAITTTGGLKCFGVAQAFDYYYPSVDGFGFNYELPYTVPGVTGN